MRELIKTNKKMIIIDSGEDYKMSEMDVENDKKIRKFDSLAAQTVIVSDGSCL